MLLNDRFKIAAKYLSIPIYILSTYMYTRFIIRKSHEMTEFEKGNHFDVKQVY